MNEKVNFWKISPVMIRKCAKAPSKAFVLAYIDYRSNLKLKTPWHFRQQDIMQETGLARNTVKAHLKALVAEGVLEPATDGVGYTLNCENYLANYWVEEPVSQCQPLTPKVSTIDTKCQPLTLKVSAIDPYIERKGRDREEETHEEAGCVSLTSTLPKDSTKPVNQVIRGLAPAVSVAPKTMAAPGTNAFAAPLLVTALTIDDRKAYEARRKAEAEKEERERKHQEYLEQEADRELTLYLKQLETFASPLKAKECLKDLPAAEKVEVLRAAITSLIKTGGYDQQARFSYTLQCSSESFQKALEFFELNPKLPVAPVFTLLSECMDIAHFFDNPDDVPYEESSKYFWAHRGGTNLYYFFCHLYSIVHSTSVNWSFSPLPHGTTYLPVPEKKQLRPVQIDKEAEKERQEIERAVG